MEPAGEAPAAAVWVCPRCGARLVSRGLWHSCGQFTLEDLFARSTPETLELARAYVALLHSLRRRPGPAAEDAPGCGGPGALRRAAARARGFIAGFALHRWMERARLSVPSTTGHGGACTRCASTRRLILGQPGRVQEGGTSALGSFGVADLAIAGERTPCPAPARRAPLSQHKAWSCLWRSPSSSPASRRRT